MADILNTLAKAVEISVDFFERTDTAQAWCKKRSTDIKIEDTHEYVEPISQGKPSSIFVTD